jgi:hypothetical protein
MCRLPDTETIASRIHSTKQLFVMIGKHSNWVEERTTELAAVTFYCKLIDRTYALGISVWLLAVPFSLPQFENQYCKRI